MKDLLAFALFYKEMEADDLYNGVRPSTMKFWLKEWRERILLEEDYEYNIDVEMYYKEADELIKLFKKE